MSKALKIADLVVKPRDGAAHSIAWNYAGYAFQVGVNVGTTAYIVRRVSVLEYGLLFFVLSLSTTLYLLDMGLSSVLVQMYVSALAREGKDRFNELMSTSFWFLAMLGAVGLLIFSLVAALLPGPFQIPHEYLHEASVIFVVAALVIQVSFPRIALEQAYQACSRYDRINQVQLLVTAAQCVLTVLVLTVGYRIVALALVQLAAAVLSLLLLLLGLPESIPQASLQLTRFRGALLKPVVHLSKWAFFENMGACLFNLCVWSILGSFSSMRETAMFGLATKFPAQLKNAVDKGAHVSLPLMSERVVNDDPEGLRQIFFKTQKLVFGAVLPFIVLGCVFARPLIEVLAGSAYEGAALITQFLLLAALGDAVLYSSTTLLYASGRVKRAAWMSTVGSTVGICGSLIAVSRFGAAGVACMVACTQLFFGGGWFTMEACKACCASPMTLVHVALQGVAKPTAIMVAAITVILCFWNALSPLWLVGAAAVSGCAYLWLWIARAALPLCRKPTGITL